MDYYITKAYPITVDIDYAVQIAWKHGIELKEAIKDEEKEECDCYEAEKSTGKGEYEFYIGIVNKSNVPQISELADTELSGKLVFVVNYSFFSETEPFYKGILKEYVEKTYRKLLKELKADFHAGLFSYGKMDSSSELKDEIKEISRILNALEDGVEGDDIMDALRDKMSTIKWSCEKCETEQTSKFLWEEIESKNGVKMYGSTPIECENKKCENVRLLVSYHSKAHNLAKKMMRRR